MRYVNRNYGKSYKLDKTLKTMTYNKTLPVNTKKSPIFLNTEVLIFKCRISLFFSSNNKRNEMQIFSN